MSWASTYLRRFFLSIRCFWEAPNPMTCVLSLCAILRSIPSKAPPQMKRMFWVLTWMNSCSGCLRPPFGGTFITLYRGHAFVTGEEKKEKDLIDATAYHDMQELLIASDVLVSDYSSAMWDFSFLDRPVFVYAPDMQNYIDNERDFAYPPEKWPYPIAKSNDELVREIETFDREEYDKRMQAHHADAGSYENAHSSEKAAALIESVCFPE